MTISTMRARLLASSMITGVALLAATGAYAADATDTAATPATAAAGELVVTGSRIPTPNLTSVSPVQVVTSQEIRLEGTTNVETLLNNLPQVSPDFGLTSDNGTSGEATVDLRGLGAKRTLVLVDGRRLMPGDPLNPVPNLDNIPAALVDRVDVLTGGASAVYGSDAVAGVVNFIMKKDFQGLRLDAQFSAFDYPNNNPDNVDAALTGGVFGNGVPITYPTKNFWGGQTWDATVIMGMNSPDNKGNITAYAEYRHVDPITQGQLDYGRCQIETESLANPVYDTHYCSGSSNSAFGKFTPASAFRGHVGALSDNPNATNTFVPFTGAFYYNFAPYQYQLSENERYSAGFFAHYDINDHVKVYSDFMFARSETQGQLGPSGLFQDVYNVNCNNPLLTAGGTAVGSQAYDLCGVNAGTATVAQAAIGFRFANVGGVALPRDYDYTHAAYKIDLGVRGDIVDGWTYDAYLQYGLSDFTEQVRGNLSKTTIQNALLVDPATGNCFVGAPCVPLNIFNINGLTNAAANYVSAPGLEVGFTREQIAEVDIVGDLGRYGIKSPFATEGVGVAVGADYRGEHLGLTTDALTASGDISGSGGATPPANGGYDVREVYGEIRVPLVQDVPFFKLLEVDGGYRYSDYTSAGATRTYKVTGEWSPIEDIRFRGGYNRAVRAPNIVELFTPQTGNLFTGSDPCAGSPILPGNSLYAGCLASFSNSNFTQAQAAALLAAGGANTGIPQCAASQCNQIVGGNPTLKPEVADTYTAGVVLQPHWVPGLTMTIDYFDIKVTNLIEGGLGGPLLEVDQCATTANPVYCNLVHRDPVFGSISLNNGAVFATNINAGALQTSGVDFDFNYRVRLADYFGIPENYGSLTFNYVGTYTRDFLNTPVAGKGTYNCVGLYGDVCGTPTPYWRSKLRVTWAPTSLPLTISVQWRYIGGVGLDANHMSDPFLAGGVPQNIPGTVVYDTAEAHISSFSYFDLSATYRIMDKYSLRAGVNNIFAKDPPVLSSAYTPLPFGNGNTFPNVYDSLGRQVFVGLTADF